MIAAALRRIRREDGFTLIELVVVMPVLTLVLAGIGAIIVSLTHWNSVQTEQLTLQQTVRPTLDALTRDVRSAMPPSTGGLALLSADSSSIVFYSPDATAAQSGPSSPFHLREVAYRFSGGALQSRDGDEHEHLHDGDVDDTVGELDVGFGDVSAGRLPIRCGLEDAARQPGSQHGGSIAGAGERELHVLRR